MKLTIGKRVKELRVKNKMTQEQLAEAVDACVGYISKIENNRVNNISLSLACELASVLNVSLGYLVGESTENEMMDEEMLRKYGACTADEKRKLLKIVDILTFYIRPKKNHITFISLTQSELSSDFKLIDKQLRHENKYDIHYILLMFEKNLWGDFKYFLNCLKQLVEIKKSSLVILNDNNYVISHMKPKNVKVLQIWHACGAVKKFGNQIKRQYPVQNYDYVLCNAEYWKDPYSQAFNVEKDQVLVTGMPRIDTLLNLNGKDEFYLKYPELKDKKLCLYAPTFRGNIIDGFKIQSFDFTKIKDYIVLYKFHPLLGDIQCKGGINMNKEDLYTLMQVSDCLISDYSSVIFDYSLLNKPMISYIPDIDEYKQDIGLNIDFNDFPGPVCTDEDQLMEALKFEDYDYDKLSYFQMKYMVYTDGRNTSRVVDTINQIMEEA